MAGSPLTQLVYCSELCMAAADEYGPAGLSRLLERARVANEAAGITGVLMYDNGRFVQVLEGSRVAVTELFVRIAADRRHERVTLLSVSDVHERSYPDWAMAYLAPSAALRAMLRTFVGGKDFDPLSMAAEPIRAMVPRLLAPTSAA